MIKMIVTFEDRINPRSFFMDIITDELKSDKTPFILKITETANDLGNNYVRPVLIGSVPNKGFITVGFEDLGGEDKDQQVIAAGGTPEMLERCAESLLDHPVLGSLLEMKMATKMIADRFGKQD